MVTQPRGIPTEKPIKWTSVNVQEVIDSDYRLKASTFGIESRQIRMDLERCKWSIVHLGDKFIEDAFYLGRFKRTYVEEKVGIPFILPSQITEIYPKAINLFLQRRMLILKAHRLKKDRSYSPVLAQSVWFLMSLKPLKTNRYQMMSFV